MEKKAIILNKPFVGSWCSVPGRIPHEIINFLLTDYNEYYVYNNPWGVCPAWVKVGKSLLKKPNKKQETHEVKYMLLTGTWTKSSRKTEILYCIRLKQKLHNLNRSRVMSVLKSRQSIVQTDIIDKKNIIYGGKKLYSIYGPKDESFYVTFEAEKIYKPKVKLEVSLDYTYQRDKGYIKNDTNKNDYNKLIELIESNEKWKEVSLVNIKKGFKHFEEFVENEGMQKLNEALKKLKKGF